MTTSGRNEDHPGKGFRGEADVALRSDWLAPGAFTRTYPDRAMAVALAIEGVDNPAAEQVRVVDVATMAVVWRSTDEA
jgi:hypothetical protein